jgi:hypothetical protein
MLTRIDGGEQPDAHCERRTMLIAAGIGSLSKRCQYCSKALAAYPLILSDNVRLAVYHAACAAVLATEILVDLYTFLSPPAPYQQLFVLTAPDAAPPQQTSVERE